MPTIITIVLITSILIYFRPRKVGEYDIPDEIIQSAEESGKTNIPDDQISNEDDEQSTVDNIIFGENIEYVEEDEPTFEKENVNTTTAQTQETPQGVNIQTTGLTEMINSYRERNNIPKITESSDLNELACNRLSAVDKNFSHDGWEIQTDLYWEGELLYSSSNPSIADAIAQWTQSSDHISILLDARWTEHGYCMKNGIIVSRFRVEK